MEEERTGRIFIPLSVHGGISNIDGGGKEEEACVIWGGGPVTCGYKLCSLMLICFSLLFPLL